MVDISKVNYQGWQNCYRLANNKVELIITADVGPRVIRFGFLGEENEFWEHSPDLGQTGGNEWRLTGGHRLWHAPEDPVRTYFPDNLPVQVELGEGQATFTQPTETTTRIQKEIEISLTEDEARATVVHRLYNRSPWEVELAPWALSMMAPGGTAIGPLPPSGTHPKDLITNRSLAIWAYTDMTDPRWTWGKDFILLHSIPGAPNPQKVGIWDTHGWAAYARQGHLFVDGFHPVPGAVYPDFQVSVEFFTDSRFLEVETLAPLQFLQPDEVAVHIESWFLLRDIPQPQGEEDVRRDILPAIERLAW